MKKTKIAYWIFTVLFAAIMLGSAIPNIMIIPEAVEGFKQMGYPVYLIPFLGWAKLLGVVAILVPGFPRLKEWAYAGLIFDLVGATYSIASSGTPFTDWMPMLIIMSIGMGSYGLYHKKRRAASTDQQPHLSDSVPAIS